MNITKASIKTSLEKGQLMKAIQQMLALAEKYNEKELYDFTLHQLVRLKLLEKEIAMEKIKIEDSTKQKNNILNAVIKEQTNIEKEWVLNKKMNTLQQEIEIATGDINLDEDVEAKNVTLSTGNISQNTQTSKASSGSISIGKGSKLKGVKLKTGHIKKNK